MTGWVLVEFDEHQVDLEDLVSDVAGLDLPDPIGEDRPAYPLDPKPLVRSAIRLIGSTLGIMLLATRRLVGLQSPILSGAAEAAGVLGLLQDTPVTRSGLRSAFGRDATEYLFTGAGFLSLTLSGNLLGLTLTGTGALRLLTEVRARRAAFRRHEEDLKNAPPAQPGAVLRLGSGERPPLAAEVREGTGTATGRDGLPVLVAPGSTVDAGVRLYGGPFVLELKDAPSSFAPEPRPAPPRRSLYGRYMRASALLSLGYAALSALLTRSLSRTFTALLLVNPRTAVIGMEAAATGASARVLRSGATVVSTRPDLVVRLPDALLLDGPRVLTDGLEVGGVLPLRENRNISEILGRAAGVNAASGLPWGEAFPPADCVEASDGCFDGAAATAHIAGARYSLRPVEDRDQVPEAYRLRHRGEYLLVFGSEREERPLGVLALRPRLAAGVAGVVEACQHHGVRVGVIAAGDPTAAQAVARRAGVPLLNGEKAVGAIRERQEGGALVAFVSDSASAAEALEACDLGIGLGSGRGHFPARVDLLAPDLAVVAAVVDSGARQLGSVRDSVVLSVISNVVGAAWGMRGGPAVEHASHATYITALSALGVGWMRLAGGKITRSV
jgi:hypothetical protein